MEIDLIGEPRLVRLNPNVPWKTRGNAALAARFGAGRGRRRQVAEIDSRPVWSYPSGRRLRPSLAARWLERAWNRVLAGSRTGEPGTDPALVAVERPLPASLYWNAVREVVAVPTVREVLRRHGAFIRTSGSERGIVGASAAIAWPEAHPTWELIAYRAPERWGRARRVDTASVRRARSRYADLFLCDDPRTRRLLVAPHTPCPILFGLRGTRPRAPLAARGIVRSRAGRPLGTVPDEPGKRRPSGAARRAGGLRVPIGGRDGHGLLPSRGARGGTRAFLCRRLGRVVVNVSCLRADQDPPPHCPHPAAGRPPPRVGQQVPGPLVPSGRDRTGPRRTPPEPSETSEMWEVRSDDRFPRSSAGVSLPGVSPEVAPGGSRIDRDGTALRGRHLPPDPVGPTAPGSARPRAMTGKGPSESF